MAGWWGAERDRTGGPHEYRSRAPYNRAIHRIPAIHPQRNQAARFFSALTILVRFPKGPGPRVRPGQTEIVFWGRFPRSASADFLRPRRSPRCSMPETFRRAAVGKAGGRGRGQRGCTSTSRCPLPDRKRVIWDAHRACIPTRVNNRGVPGARNCLGTVMITLTLIASYGTPVCHCRSRWPDSTSRPWDRNRQKGLPPLPPVPPLLPPAAQRNCEELHSLRIVFQSFHVVFWRLSAGPRVPTGVNPAVGPGLTSMSSHRSMIRARDVHVPWAGASPGEQASESRVVRRPTSETPRRRGNRFPPMSSSFARSDAVGGGQLAAVALCHREWRSTPRATATE